MTCPAGKILNPDTGRCVLRKGKVGQEVLRRKSKSPKGSKKSKSCPSEKILNPDTGICVLRTGKVGQQILAKAGSRKVSPKSAKQNLVRSFKIKWSLYDDYDGDDSINKVQKIIIKQTKSIIERNANVSVKLTPLSSYVFRVDVKYKSRDDYDDIDQFDLLVSYAENIHNDGNYPHIELIGKKWWY